MTLRLLGCTALVCGLAGGCATNQPLTFCTRELRVRFSPSDTTVLSGQAFTSSVQLSSCGGAEILSDVVSWHSENPAVATVDSLAGRVTGRSPGARRISATG